MTHAMRVDARDTCELHAGWSAVFTTVESIALGSFSVEIQSSPRPLSSRFYRGSVEQVAQRLIGQRLVSEIGGQRVAGIIVETESYLAEGDSACHGFKGRTPKNEVMFGLAGRAYVYPIHAKSCFNVVTGRRGAPSAVLIRALQPIEGIEIMQRRRGRERLLDLARGPARLCQALAIDRDCNGLDLSQGQRVWIESANSRQGTGTKIRITRRIGVTSAKDMLLRFALEACPFVSGPRNWH